MEWTFLNGMAWARHGLAGHSIARHGVGMGLGPSHVQWRGAMGVGTFIDGPYFAGLEWECRNARRQPGDGQAGQARHGMGSSQKRLGGGGAPNSQPDEKTPEPSMGGP